MSKTLILYAGNIGLCATINSIVYAIDYCEKNNMKLRFCPKYGLYGDVTKFIDFGVECIKVLPPGYAMNPHPEYEFAHPYWDGPNNTQALFDKIVLADIPFERQRAIALTFKPLVPIPELPCEVFDAVHIRRGDAFTVPQGCEYHVTNDYLEKTSCDDVFIMSDDHRVLDEVSSAKKIHHMIPADADGWYAVLGSITKPTEQTIFAFQPQHKKDENTIRLIQEMYIAAKSQKFIHTFSNVSRFIKLIHRDPSQCIDLQNTISK